MQDDTASRVGLESLRRQVIGLRPLLAAVDSAVASERSANVKAMTSLLDEIDAAMAAHLDVDQRIACPFCQGMIRPAATMCGFCWRKQKPQADAKS